MVNTEATSATAYKERVRVFYDKLSPHFRNLWGEHLHDGLYETGNETKEAAQEKLVAFLADFGGIPFGARGIDIGCGMGATSVWLAKHRQADMTGITLSPTQVRIARELAARERINANFLVADADRFTVDRPFDFAWMVGVLGHFEDQQAFVRDCGRLIRKGGRFVLADWVAAPDLSLGERRNFVDPVLEGMLMPTIATLNQYVEWFGSSGFRVLDSRDLSRETAKTWDEGVSILRAPDMIRMAWDAGHEAIGLMAAVKGMRYTMEQGLTRYGILVAEKI